MRKFLGMIFVGGLLMAAGAANFQDDFEGAGLNFAKWSPHAPGKVDLGGLQTWSPEAVTVSGGQVHITARRSANGFTSGVITTFGNFAQTYGRIEIRCRAPRGRGVESVFRLLPIPSGELPSFDVVKIANGEATFTTRWGDARGDRDYAGNTKIADGFHTIVAEWDEEKIVWSVDGVEKLHSFDGVPHQPLYLVAMLLVNSADAAAPETLDIDYVRVFGRP